jgi:hypothetical protein
MSGNNLFSPDGTEWTESISDEGEPSWAKVDDEVDPPDPPDPPDVENPGYVTFGDKGHIVNGTDIERDIDFLVRYTTTPTNANEWGVDVILDSESDEVVSVNNRIATTNKTKTPFDEASQYVLSGHGHGGATAGQFLLDNAKPGAVAVFSGEAPEPPDPPVPGTDDKMFGSWYMIFQPPTMPGFWSGAGGIGIWNTMSIALLQSGGSGTGKLTLNCGSGGSEPCGDYARDVGQMTEAGVKVLMAFGGSSDGGITITNANQAEEAFQSFKKYKEDQGIPFQGIDVDLEPSGGSWTEAGLIPLVDKCKSRWGDEFLCALTPGLYGEYTAKWMSAARNLGDKMAYMSPMLYDFPEAKTYEQLMPVIRNKISIMSNDGHIPLNKQVLALMLQPYDGYSASPPDVINRCMQTSMQEYPDLLGMILWEHYLEGKFGYPISHGPVRGYLGLTGATTMAAAEQKQPKKWKRPKFTEAEERELRELYPNTNRLAEVARIVDVGDGDAQER